MRHGDLQCGVSQLGEAAQLLGGSVPLFGQAVATTGQGSAIAGETDGQRAARMSGPSADLFAGIHIPETDVPVFAATGEDFCIGSPGEAGDRLFVAGEILDFESRLGFPHP